MDNWLETLIGTVLIGGTIAVVSHQSKKEGYNNAIKDISERAQNDEIARLRAELNDLKMKQLT